MSSWGISNEDEGTTATVVRRRNHLIVGTRSPADRFLWLEYIIESPQLMKIITKEIRIDVGNNKNITQVNAYDQTSDGTGAYATLISGGPGFQHVELRFVSQIGGKIYFVVELYGKN
ncbi:probable salivary secreted peptide [Leptopilina heterotoma]|uniref:probable salivary secreted peptide n=1 Tax=Leptopilina heterotoma TaxID=63436 RepID=UPI001CA80728|nr:probable salivary secreted peptide [Leptopilina heterotoma]